jgi:hypothetical protein
VTEILVGTRSGLRESSGEGQAVTEPIVALAADGPVRWALVGDGDILRSDDGAWEPAGSVDRFTGRCLLPTDDALLIGTSEAHLFRLHRGAVELDDGFEAAPGRGDWTTPWGGPPDTRSMAVDRGGARYVNVHVGGILRSREPGTWEPTIDMAADVHQVIAHPSRPGTVLAACARGLAVSADGGDSWEIAADGLHAPYARAVAMAGDTVLVTASTGPFTDRAAIYRRPMDGGGPFERCTGGLPEWFPSNIDTHCLAAGDSLVAFAADNAVWVSEDEGRTWDRGASDLPAVTCVAIG